MLAGDAGARMAFEPIRLSTEHLPRQGRNDIIRDYYGKIAQRTELELIAGEDAISPSKPISIPG